MTEEQKPILLLVGAQASDLPIPERTLGGGRRIVLAENGAQAIQRIRDFGPTVVMFGFDLDDMTGAELCRRIRADERLRSTSLLFVTDKGMDEHVDLCMAAGCNDIIFRPIEDQDLLEKVRTFSTLAVRKELRTLTKVELLSPDESLVLIGHSINISSSGMLLELTRLLSPGSRIRVTLYLPHDAMQLSAEATVFRADFEGSHPRYGVKFDELPQSDRERIDRYVQRMEKREAS